MADLQRAFMSLPPVTRTLLAGTAAVTLPTMLGLVSPYAIIFHPPLLRYKLQLWRAVTPFFYAGSGIAAIFNVFFLFRTSSDLESGMFKNRSHDLAWGLLLINSIIIGLNYPLKSVVLFRPLLLALTHLSAQYSPETPMNLYGFVTIPAKYLSFALLLLDLVQGGPSAAVEGLTGIIAAHVFWYISEVYPRANPGSSLTRYVDTPAWFKKLWGLSPSATASGGSASGPAGRRERSVAGGVTSFQPAAGQGQRSGGNASSSFTTTGHQWGSGNRLGSD